MRPAYIIMSSRACEQSLHRQDTFTSTADFYGTNDVPILSQAWTETSYATTAILKQYSNPSLAQLLQTVHKPIGKDALLTYYFNFESVLATINNFFRLPSTSSEAKSNQPADPSFRKKNKTKLNLSAEPIIKLTQTTLQQQRC